jgi:hypothetical protein
MRLVIVENSPDHFPCCKRNTKAATASTHPVRRGEEAVLIHKHRARLSPRVIPGPSQFVALFSSR